MLYDIFLSSELKLCIVDSCVPKASKGPSSSEMDMSHPAILAAVDRGKLSQGVRTLSNMYFLKLERFFLGETML